MLGRLGRLAYLIAAVEQAHIHNLPNQVEKVDAREFHEAGAEKNVIMDVIDTDGQIGKPDFGGVRLKLHPGWMGGRWLGTRFQH
jgi:hypothetical protein